MENLLRLAVKGMRNKDFIESDQVTLGELISALERMPKDKILTDAFRGGDSYRGFYDELAFKPCAEVKVGDLLKDARSCVGVTFDGYKGGEYTMHLNTPIWKAEYGSCGDEITRSMLKEMEQK
jgi:hypothetical protein